MFNEPGTELCRDKKGIVCTLKEGGRVEHMDTKMPRMTPGVQGAKGEAVSQAWEVGAGPGRGPHPPHHPSPLPLSLSLRSPSEPRHLLPKEHRLGGKMTGSTRPYVRA